MQASVCLERNRRLYRFVWINEDRQGVYVGIYGRHRGLHGSYHKDGTRHITGVGRRVPEKHGPPIKDLRTNHEILGCKLPLVDEIIGAHASLYRPSNKTDLNVVIGQQSLSPDKILVIGTQLVNAEVERQLMEALLLDVKASTTLVAYYLWRLDFFPTHKVGVIVYQEPQS